MLSEQAAFTFIKCITGHELIPASGQSCIYFSLEQMSSWTDTATGDSEGSPAGPCCELQVACGTRKAQPLHHQGSG